MIALVLGAFPALYGGLFAKRFWMIGVGICVFLAALRLFARFTKEDPHCRDVFFRTLLYSHRYLPVARWDQTARVRRYR